MALFDKLFVTKRKLYNGDLRSRDQDRSCKFTSEQVRLLLFKECDWKGRKLLFDSSTIQRIPNGHNIDEYARQASDPPYIVETSKDFTFLYTGPAADATLIGEMIFGAVALSYRGISFKIHITDQPSRLMCTKIFSVPGTSRSQLSDGKISTNKCSSISVGSFRDTTDSTKSMNQTDESVSLSFSFDRGDSGFYGDQTPQSSVTSASDYCTKFDFLDEQSSEDDMYSFDGFSSPKLSVCSNGSWESRAPAARLTACKPLDVISSDSQFSSRSAVGGTADSLLGPGGGAGAGAGGRRAKLGLALLITLEDHRHIEAVRHCLEQSVRVRALMRRLRRAALTAGARGARFVSTLHAALHDAALWVSDVLYGPRVPSTWLALAGGDVHAGAVLDALCSLLAYADTKHTNFFMSTLLTHVLTYHLGWVKTVSPYRTAVPPAPAHEPRPRDPLWAQLAQLCGAVGHPPRRARTVVCGRDDPASVRLLDKLLFILAYFIRCGDLHRTDYNLGSPDHRRNDIVIVNDDEKVLLEKPPKGDLSKDTCTLDDDTRRATSHEDESSVDKSNEAPRTAPKTEIRENGGGGGGGPLKRTPTVILPAPVPSDGSLDSSDSEKSENEQKVVFVLGDDDKLIGLKNKSTDGRRVKKSSKVQNEPVELDMLEGVPSADGEDGKACDRDCARVAGADRPARCCADKLQHSKPIKHSGFKFEFDKYPQIVTNYMKSKNLEILDRHYIGKPGNLKLDNFQFDPTVVPPIQEERCDTCYKCQVMESMLQTPTNASELEFMSDMPSQPEPQYARREMVSAREEPVPKTFVRRRKQNTVVVNATGSDDAPAPPRVVNGVAAKAATAVGRVLEFADGALKAEPSRGGAFASTLLGGVSDHYVPDLILQGTTAKPSVWEAALESEVKQAGRAARARSIRPVPHAVAIIGDTATWQVRVAGSAGAGGAGGMSALVATTLEALPHMHSANVPPAQCLSWLEGRLREVCVLSKTLGDVLMSRDLCDVRALTRCLRVHASDVPLLLAVACAHTPQLAQRYGLTYK